MKTGRLPSSHVFDAGHEAFGTGRNNASTVPDRSRQECNPSAPDGIRTDVSALQFQSQ